MLQRWINDTRKTFGDSCGLATACCCVVTVALCATAASAASAAPVAAQMAAPALASGSGESRAALVATGFAQITGLAISPLLVLMLLGWYDFAQAGGFGATSSLPLHANPWFLVPCSLVLLAVLLKKVVAGAIPLPVRKLLDACEYLEAKCSALVAAGVLLPTIITTMAAVDGGASANAPQTAMLGGLSPLLWITPLALIVYFSVWITFHAIDALIVLSPFAIIDAMLLAARGSVLVVVALAFLVSPVLAFIVCLPIMLGSLLVAGWCIRLDLFALCVATDLLFARRSEPRVDADGARAFIAARGYGVPIRTMGHARPCAEGVAFRYRPFFVFASRTIVLTATQPVLVHGTLWSTLRQSVTARGLVAFPPRYSRATNEIAAAFGASIREGLLRRSWRGVREAFASILSGPSVTA